MKLKSVNPHNNTVIGEVKTSSDTEIAKAVEAAHQAKHNWKEIGVKQRIKHLKQVLTLLDSKKDDIATQDTKEMGFPIDQCKEFNIGDGFGYFKWMLDNIEEILRPEITHQTAQEIHTVYKEPYGVTAVIQPWNFPFCQWSWGVVPNLLAGNTIVYKPSEETPLSGKLIENIISHSSLPNGVLNFVYGDGSVGAKLLDKDINLVVFTGSTKTGQEIYEKAARKFIPATLELGGSAPGIIFKDANIDDTVEHVFWLRYTNCGQACDGLKRLIVHESIFDKVVSKLKQRIKKETVGDPLNKDNFFGPLAAKRQLDLLVSQFEDAISKGAQVITGGKSSKKGFYFNPTILTHIKTNMRVWQEEVFGPILPVVSFKSEAEAVQLANDTQYGLGSYIYTQDKKLADKVATKIEAGMVSINGTNYVLPMNPFGGYKKSGIGREFGKYGFDDITQIKVVSKNK